MQVAIYTGKDPGGKRFLSTLARRIDRQEIRAWELRRKSPLVLVHSGDRYAGVRVTFFPSGTRSYAKVARDGSLGAFQSPEPSLVATVVGTSQVDRVLSFLVGLLTRHAEPLGVEGIGIPLTE